MTVEVKHGGKTEKVQVEPKPNGLYTVYGVERAGGKVEYVVVGDELKDAEAGKVMFRAISFAGQDVDISVKPLVGDVMDAKALKSGAASSNMVSTPQSFTVSLMVGGKSVGQETVEAKDGETYTIAVTADAKPAVKIFHNNPKMKAAPGGASAAG